MSRNGTSVAAVDVEDVGAVAVAVVVRWSVFGEAVEKKKKKKTKAPPRG